MTLFASPWRQQPWSVWSGVALTSPDRGLPPPSPPQMGRQACQHLCGLQAQPGLPVGPVWVRDHPQLHNLGE